VSNEIEIMKAQLSGVQRRVKVLEQSVRPLTSLQGVDGNLLSDQAVTAYCAELKGSTLAAVSGEGRMRETAAARKAVARLLHQRLGWPVVRIARNLNRSENGVRRLLEGEG